MIHKIRKGSLTVMASLTIMLVATLLFTLLEASHYMQLRRIGELNSASVTESAFAGYLRPLWENYHLLGRALSGEDYLQVDSLENELLEASNQNMYPISGWSLRHNLLQMQTLDVEMVECRLMTDDNGMAFQAATAGYMRNLLQINTLQQLLNNSNAAKELLKEPVACEEKVQQAKAAISPGKDNVQGSDMLGKFTEDVDRGILELVLEDPDVVSQKSIRGQALVSNRQLASGNSTEEISADFLDALLMDLYLMENLSGYADVLPNRALDYEKEYLIAGKTSDVENLKTVVHEILAIRETANFLYLCSDSEKSQLAEVAAEGIAALLANPELAEVIKWGLLAAWAYAESILDVRALLCGEKVALFKGDSDWTSDLSILGEMGSSFWKAKSSDTGVSYQDYIGMLLVIHGEKTLAYRSMDIMEATIRIMDGYENFRMDHLMLEGTFAFSYESGPIFPAQRSASDYHYQVIQKYSYRKAGV